ncbi:GntR family transcriptional regulator [Clostridium sp. Marseille-Q2269]|uniref:GntR family transcriptional regulator n=1 Tax=Clostridium sp. Marseille-Q2269 TaxID=2942205 RepID=UPI002074506D|nr:GntR family transcriptional regulator [Clostridium sp. Marseille-Q2269]
MILDHNIGAKPLWSQVADIIREDIKNNEYKVGDTLPPEMQLIEKFGVSRITMRQALDCLVNEGYIVRKRGKGTIVQKREDVSTSMKSSFVTLEEKGERAQKKFIDAKLINPPKEVAEYFNIKETDTLIMMKRIVEVDNKIVVLFRHFINPQVSLTVEDNFKESFYKLLSDKGYPITSGKEEISAIISNEEDKEIFQLEEKKAIITRKKYGFSNDIPVELTYSRYIADGYTITVDLN